EEAEVGRRVGECGRMPGSEPRKPAPADAPPRPPGEGIKVLVIDDEPFHAETVAESLERVGYECTVATSGTAGARHIDQDEYDVIVTDLKMADLDGLAILRKAKAESREAVGGMFTVQGDVEEVAVGND